MSMTSIAIVQSCSTDLQRGRKSSIHDSDKILKKMDLDEECKQQDCLLCAEDDESKVRVRNDNHSLNCKFRQNPHKLIGSKAELSSQSSNDSDDPCISRKSDIAIVHKNGEHTCPGCIVDSRGWDDQIDRAIINLPDEDLRVRKVRFLMPTPQHGPPYSQGYIEVTVHQPLTQHSWEDGKYTSYEIKLETNNRAFNVKSSQVRRRYSEFRWLRNQLRSHFPDITPPQLPPRKFFGRQFNQEVIEDRVVGLQDFLTTVLEEPVYLSASVLHLFLQTELPIEEIIDCMEHRSSKSVLQTILDANKPLPPRNDSDTTINDLSSQSSGYSSNSEELLDNTPSLYGSINDANEPPSPETSTPATLSVPCSLKQAFRRHSSYSSYSSLVDSVASSNSSRCGSLEGNKGQGRNAKKVTFSPEVTVAEVIDRFDRDPRRVSLSSIPSSAFASTTAY